MRYLRSECHLAENSVLAYERDLRRFFDWLRGRRIEGLSISELSDYPAWLTAQELAPASISRHVVSLKVFFRYLQLEGVLTDNQAELLGTQKLWQRVPTVLSQRRDRRAADGAASRRGRGGGATGRCWSCCTPRAAACRSCRCCGRATCTWPSAIACATARATSSASCRWAGRRSRRSKRILQHERPKLAERREPPSQFLLLSSRGGRLRRERIWELIKLYAKTGRLLGRAEPALAAAQLRDAPAWPAAPTCGRCRKCSATPASPRRRSTRTSTTRGSRRSTTRFTRGREKLGGASRRVGRKRTIYANPCQSRCASGSFAAPRSAALTPRSSSAA